MPGFIYIDTRNHDLREKLLASSVSHVACEKKNMRHKMKKQQQKYLNYYLITQHSRRKQTRQARNK